MITTLFLRMTRRFLSFTTTTTTFTCLFQNRIPFRTILGGIAPAVLLVVIYPSVIGVNAFQNPSTAVVSSWPPSNQQRFFNSIATPMTTTTKMSSSTTTTANESSNPLSNLGLPSPLLLGSASFTRKLILKEMGIPFVKMVRPIDEKALGDRSNDKPSDLVLTLAKAKMDHLVSEIEKNPNDLPQNQPQNQQQQQQQQQSEWLVLTGDQVVTCNGSILEKPDSVQQAKDFCQMYATFPPATVGSCVITHLPSKIQVSGVDTATIYFKSSIGQANLIETLVEAGEPIMSCAGGLMIEHPLTKEHLDRIDGTEDSVMGLSKDLVLRLLAELAEKVKEGEKK